MESREFHIFSVKDNGVGFNLDLAEQHGGLGLKGMRERAEQINADLQITSGENGTQVSVEMPYE